MQHDSQPFGHEAALDKLFQHGLPSINVDRVVLVIDNCDKLAVKCKQVCILVP